MKLELANIWIGGESTMREININEKTYEVHSVTGKVAAANKQLETKVHGGGGGGYTNQGSGYTAPVTISSTTITHDDIYLVDTNGKEHAIRLQNWDVACREGHELDAVWLIKKGKNEGPYVALRNKTLNQTNWNNKVLEIMHRPAWYYPCASFLVFPVLGFAWSCWVVVASFVYWGILGKNRAKAFKASGQLLENVA